MAYKKNYNKNYNRNRNNRYNGGQGYNDNKKFYYMDRPQEQKPTFEGFDASQFKKPDITIKDLNGKVYTISGNFSTAFSAELIKTSERVDEIRNGSNDLEKFPQIFDLLRDWCLSLINHNVDGETYTMDDVKRGFDDIYVLYNLVGYIGKVISASNREIPNLIRQ